MTLSLPPVPEKHRDGWSPGVEEGALEATATSEPIAGDQTMTEADLIALWHLDPATWEIIPGTLLVNRWQAMTGRATRNAPVWMRQYKARLRRIIDAEHLPNGIRVAPVFNVTVTGRGRRKPGELPGDGWRVGVFSPDPQFGYWWGDDGTLHTIHDERCFDIRNQVLVDLRAEYGHISKIVHAGDTMDNAHFSRFTKVPAYVERTLQPTIDRTSLEWETLRAICPDRELERLLVLDGNHDNPRLIRSLIASGLGALVGIRQGGEDLADHPVLSVQHLTQTERHGVEYCEPFPTGMVEFNEGLACAHGPAYSSKKLGTATKILAETRRSLLHGHTHREEMIATTLWTENGPRTFYVASPGTFCRTDLAVPSAKSATTSRGVPAIGMGTEDWAQGFIVVLYDTEGSHFSLEHVRIWNGTAAEGSVAYFRGRRYESTCDADGGLL